MKSTEAERQERIFAATTGAIKCMTQGGISDEEVIHHAGHFLSHVFGVIVFEVTDSYAQDIDEITLKALDAELDPTPEGTDPEAWEAVAEVARDTLISTLEGLGTAIHANAAALDRFYNVD